MRKLLIAFLLLIFVPIGVSATSYWLGDRQGNWQTADRSSAGLLPTASNHSDALIRVYAARTVRWRGIFAVHTWIVFKEHGALHYARYDYTAWGEPIRTNGFAPDGRWFGAAPETIVAVDGDNANRLIPKQPMQFAVFHSPAQRSRDTPHFLALTNACDCDPGIGNLPCTKYFWMSSAVMKS